MEMKRQVKHDEMVLITSSPALFRSSAAVEPHVMHSTLGSVQLNQLFVARARWGWAEAPQADRPPASRAATPAARPPSTERRGNLRVSGHGPLQRSG